ncbi:MAG TPA: acyloxyacyl hydrolase [Fimbriimonadaceae bacterium]|nr:acyloxyacyl hydrolase [Fimbriimonadaceae bacterium]
MWIAWSGLVGAVLASSGGVIGPEPKSEEWMAWVFLGQSWFLLGSEDFRQGGGLAIQRIRREPHLTYKGSRGELVWELNAATTVGGDKFEWPGDTTTSIGALALARWPVRWARGVFGYVEAGWGLQYASALTIDLPSRLNSTPTLGFGFDLGERLRLGVRYLHISNAGTVGNNPGQNQLFVMVGYRF